MLIGQQLQLAEPGKTLVLHLDPGIKPLQIPHWVRAASFAIERTR